MATSHAHNRPLQPVPNPKILPCPTQLQQFYTGSQLNDYHDRLNDHVLNTKEKLDEQTQADILYSISGLISYSSYAPLTSHDSTFLWQGWLPRASLVLLEGPMGIGKTTFCTDLAARISRQAPFPNGQPADHTKTDVIVISSTAHAHYDTFDSLQSVGAATENIYELNRIPSTSVVSLDPQQSKRPPIHSSYGFTFSEFDLQSLTNALDNCDGPSLVIIDDLQSTLCAHPKAKNSSFLSEVMLHLTTLAHDYDATILMLRDTPNPGESRASHCREQLSPIFAHYATVHLRLTPDPDNPDHAALLSCSRTYRGTLPSSLRVHFSPLPTSPNHTGLYWDQTPSPWTGKQLRTLQSAPPLNTTQQTIIDTPNTTQQAIIDTPNTTQQAIIDTSNTTQQAIIDILTAHAPNPLTPTQICDYLNLPPAKKHAATPSTPLPA